MPTTIARDEFQFMCDELAVGRLAAAIPVEYQGGSGILTQSFNASKVDFDKEDAALYAAFVAIRSTHRTARKAGATTRS